VEKEGTVWKDLELLNRALECASNEELRERFSTFIKLAKIGVTDSLEREFVRGSVSTSAYRNIIGSDPRIELLRERSTPVVVKAPGPDYSEYALKALDLLLEKTRKKTPQAHGTV
jgi:hypothetical protein